MADEGDDDAKGSVEKYVDDKSAEKVHKYEDGTPKDDDGDTWANLVAHLTGYPMPKRSTLFEKLTSDHGGPLFRMDFQDHDVAEVLKSGFEVNSGEDYDIWFFTGPGNARLKQARIVFEGDRAGQGRPHHLGRHLGQDRGGHQGGRGRRVHGLQQGHDEQRGPVPLHERASHRVARPVRRGHHPHQFRRPQRTGRVRRRPQDLRRHGGLLRSRGQVLQGLRDDHQGLGGRPRQGRRRLEGRVRGHLPQPADQDPGELRGVHRHLQRLRRPGRPGPDRVLPGAVPGEGRPATGRAAAAGRMAEMGPVGLLRADPCPGGVRAGRPGALGRGQQRQEDEGLRLDDLQRYLVLRHDGGRFHTEPPPSTGTSRTRRPGRRSARKRSASGTGPWTSTWSNQRPPSSPT